MFEFEPVGVCIRKIAFRIVDGKLHEIQFTGGCPGNLSAIVKLLEGTDAVKVAKLLKGNKCGSKSTSCADQLAIAIEKAIEQINISKAS